MNGCTINIADFRCRAIKSRAARPSFWDAQKPAGITLVEVQNPQGHRGLQLMEAALLQENPAVYDIGVAREAQRKRPRMVFRPIGIPRRAKVLRFNSHEPLRMPPRVEESREKWRGATDGPYDLPPAA